MPGNLPSYAIFIKVYDVSSVLLANAQVTLRNERSNDTLNAITNSVGEVLFDGANFTNGIITGDVLTAYSLYTNYEASVQHTVTIGGVDLILTMQSVPASGSLRYFTAQKFYETYGMPLNDNNTELIKATEVVRVGLQVEQEIDTLLNQKFDNNSGSYYTITQEYQDGHGYEHPFYFLKKTPIHSITTLQTTTDVETTVSPTWNTLVEDTDFIADYDTGRIKIVTGAFLPPYRLEKRFRATYTYGYDSVPLDIQKLAILMTMSQFAMGNMARNLVFGRETPNADALRAMNDEIQRIKDSRIRYNIQLTY